MAYCRNCGAEIPDKANYCGNCGYKARVSGNNWLTVIVASFLLLYGLTTLFGLIGTIIALVISVAMFIFLPYSK